jgi:hypothetical protein
LKKTEKNVDMSRSSQFTERGRNVTDPLKQEKEYLKSHQVKLAEQYPGKYLLIKGDTVHGAFETYEQGVIEGAKLFGASHFLVRSVLQPDDVEAPSIPALSVGVPLVAHP